MSFDENLLKKSILIISDFDSSYTEIDNQNEKKYIDTLIEQINAYGVKVFYEEVKDESTLRQTLSKYNKEDVIIFNWCERFNETEGTESQATKVYEELGYVFTGGSSRTLDLVSDKYRVFEILKKNNIPIPETYFVKAAGIESFDIDFSKKYIVKSNNLHASIGISMSNIVTTKEGFLAAAKALTTAAEMDLLVQKYIEGQEYTAPVWGSIKPEALPILKIDYTNAKELSILTHNAKDYSKDEYEDSGIVLSDINENPRLYLNIQDVVVKTFVALQMEDYARFEVRVNNKEEIFVIDANANPYMNYLFEDDGSEIYLSTQALGYNWGETILKICEHAYNRNRR